MPAANQKLVISVPSSKMKMLLEALGKYDFVKIEPLEDIIQRIMKTTSKKATVSDVEIEDIVMEMRYGKSIPVTDK